jgi:hypothetical protein
MTTDELRFVIKCCTPTGKDDPSTQLKLDVLHQAMQLYSLGGEVGWGLSPLMQHFVYADFFRLHGGGLDAFAPADEADSDVIRPLESLRDAIYNVEYDRKQAEDKAA